MLGLIDEGTELAARSADDAVRATGNAPRPARSALGGLDDRLGAAAKLGDAVGLSDDVLGQALRKRAAAVADDAAPAPTPARAPAGASASRPRATPRLQSTVDDALAVLDDSARPGARAGAKVDKGGTHGRDAVDDPAARRAAGKADDRAAVERKRTDAEFERKRQGEADLQRSFERRADAKRAEYKRLEQERVAQGYVAAVNVSRSLQMTWMRRLNAVWSDPILRRHAEIGGFFDSLLAARAIRSFTGTTA